METVNRVNNNILAKKSAYSGTLKMAVGMMSQEQKEKLLEQLTAETEFLERSPNFSGSHFMQSYVDGIKSIAFMVSESRKFMDRDESREQHSYFVCRKCSLKLFPSDSNVICPSCNSCEWIELTHT